MGATTAAIAAGSVLSAGSSLLGSSQTSSAAKSAAGAAKQQYYQTRFDLSPYNTIGQTAAGNALNLANLGPTGGGPDYVGMAGQMFPGGLPGSAGATGTPGGGMTQAELEATPGYQFTLSQGLKAVQSQAAARGLGMSGASLKGAAQYATGLADKTYLDQFNVSQQKFSDVLGLNTAQQGNLTNQFNRYNALATLGENAAAQTGTIGANLTNTAANATIQSGLDQAAGTTGVSNAVTGGVNSYLANQNFNALMARFAPQTGTGGYNTPTSSGPVSGSGGDPFYGNTM